MYMCIDDVNVTYYTNTDVLNAIRQTLAKKCKLNCQHTHDGLVTVNIYSKDQSYFMSSDGSYENRQMSSLFTCKLLRQR